MAQRPQHLRVRALCDTLWSHVILEASEPGSHVTTGCHKARRSQVTTVIRTVSHITLLLISHITLAYNLTHHAFNHYKNHTTRGRCARRLVAVCQYVQRTACYCSPVSASIGTVCSCVLARLQLPPSTGKVALSLPDQREGPY